MWSYLKLCLRVRGRPGAVCGAGYLGQAGSEGDGYVACTYILGLGQLKLEFPNVIVNRLLSLIPRVCVQILFMVYKGPLDILKQGSSLQS